MSMRAIVLAGWLVGGLVADLFAEERALASERAAESKVTSKGTERRTMLVAGAERTYWLHLPRGSSAKAPYPLVLVLHPRGGTGPRMERLTGFSDKADEKGFIVVYPDALGNPRTWNAGYLAGAAEDDEDEKFLRALLDELRSTQPIDERRVFVTGLNAGAMMAYWIAGALSEQISAVAVVSGAAGVHRREGGISTIPEPKRPVSVLAFHGERNSVVPYRGGSSRSVERNFFSVDETVELWLKANGCVPDPKKEARSSKRRTFALESDFGKKKDLETESVTQASVRRSTWGGCRDKTEVVFYTLASGNHKWPGAPELLRNTILPPQELKATDLIWDFFSTHGR